MNGKMRKVKGLLAGKDPKSITFFFLDRSIILAQECGMKKEDFVDHLNKAWK